MKKSPWTPPLLCVYWVDASSGSDGWQTLEEFELPDLKCMSVGWVVNEDESQITLTATKGELPESHDFNGTITIPKTWVIRRVEIKSPETEAPGPTQ